MQIPSEKQLSDWTLEASEYMEESGRSKFPTEIQDCLFERGARRCSACRTVLVLGEFPRNRSGRKGVHHSCMACMRGINARSHQSNRDSRLEYKRRYHQENAEKISEYDRRYRAEHLDELREYDRDYYRRNPWLMALRQGYYRALEADNHAEWITPDELLESWRSRGIDPDECVYTGIELVHGVNRSLEHDVPISEGGGHVLSNLFPADSRINGSKGNRAAVKYVIETAASRPTKKEILV